jgi:heat-inducible transcriptional repressor
MQELNDREKNILRYIIQQFILTASPVGSRNIAKNYDIGLSPASVRNIMADLEDSGYINHPHTSAGRIPTDKGYRFYVDSLMNIRKLQSSEKGKINKSLERTRNETEELINITSGLLSSITNQLAYVSYPNLDSGTLEKLQIISLTSTRILVVISIKSGFVKTITLELQSSIKTSQIDYIQSILNERLAGLKLNEIRSTFGERMRDITSEEQPILRLFLDSVDKIFKDDKSPEKIAITGAKNVIRQPEFETPGKFQSIIELIEDKDVIVHILEKSSEIASDQVYISIGSENSDTKLQEYSYITKEYTIGDVSGTLGIIGPKRMEYSKIVAIVDYTSKILSEIFKQEK